MATASKTLTQLSKDFNLLSMSDPYNIFLAGLNYLGCKTAPNQTQSSALIFDLPFFFSTMVSNHNKIQNNQIQNFKLVNKEKS